MMPLKKLNQTQFIPFLNISSDPLAPTWRRVDLSTIFELSPGTRTRTSDYICYETPVEEIVGYAPELPQEIALYEGNPIYDFVFDRFYRLPIGSDAQVPALICFGGSAQRAWHVPDCRLQLGALNAVEGKLSFTLKLGGNIERGHYRIADGAPVFEAEG